MVGHQVFKRFLHFGAHVFFEGRFVCWNQFAFDAEIIFVLQRIALLEGESLSVDFKECTGIGDFKERQVGAALGLIFEFLVIDGGHAKQIVVSLLRYDEPHLVAVAQLHVFDRVKLHAEHILHVGLLHGLAVHEAERAVLQQNVGLGPCEASEGLQHLGVLEFFEGENFLRAFLYGLLLGKT